MKKLCSHEWNASCCWFNEMLLIQSYVNIMNESLFLCFCPELIRYRWGARSVETEKLVTWGCMSFIHPSTCHRSRNRRPECWHTGPEPRRRTAILQTFLGLAHTRGNKIKKQTNKQKRKRCKARHRVAANPDLYSLSVPVFVSMSLRKQVRLPPPPHHPRWSAQSG